MMWQRPELCRTLTSRRLCTTVRRRIEDEGDWFYSTEWWDSDRDSHTVFRSTSDEGNGIVSVLAFPSSRPIRSQWGEIEEWLQQRYMELHPDRDNNDRFRVLGYQWRTLHFNDDTRQSTAKVMAAYHESDPGSVFLMQQPHVLAVPYTKSMVSVGLTTIASCGFDIISAMTKKNSMSILCIGHGGGSLPLFLAKKIPGANIDIVEIDPVVIYASVKAMGFPACSVMNSLGQRAIPRPTIIDQMLWKGIHERLNLYKTDAENFVLKANNLYDMVFVDAYDGDDIFPRKLWDPDSPFLKSIANLLHPNHGTVVVNLHSDSGIMSSDTSSSYFFDLVLPTTKHVSRVCQAYKETLVGNQGYPSGLGFTVSVPWVCNATMAVCRGFKTDDRRYWNKDSVVKTILSKSVLVENVLDLPFSCLEYMKRGFTLID